MNLLDLYDIALQNAADVRDGITAACECTAEIHRLKHRQKCLERHARDLATGSNAQVREDNAMRLLTLTELGHLPEAQEYGDCSRLIDALETRRAHHESAIEFAKIAARAATAYMHALGGTA